MESGEYRLGERVMRVSADLDALSHAAATDIVQLAASAVKQHGIFSIALSGGSTPVHLHQVLASKVYAQQIDWQKVRVYFGDERNVPPEHPDSNYRMARETLLSKVAIPADNIVPIPTGCADMQDCARDYAAKLTTLPQLNGMPCFDLILLGMGGDGHTASLFPGTGILQEQQQSVAAVYVDKLKTWRVSLTYPVLAVANRIMVLVSGESKSDMLYQVFNQPDRHYPIQGVQNKHMVWYVDAAAAKRVLESDVGISG